MSLAIKLFIIFFLIESSFSKHIPDQDSNEKEDDRDDYMSSIDYSRFFKHMIEGWQREADEKFPIRTNTDDKGYLERSFFLQSAAQAYVGHWNKWKHHSGYPYGNLRNKIDVLWPGKVDTCPDFETTNLLIYIIHGLGRPCNFLRNP